MLREMSIKIKKRENLFKSSLVIFNYVSFWHKETSVERE